MNYYAAWIRHSHDLKKNFLKNWTAP
jgi:hypothetical protein